MGVFNKVLIKKPPRSVLNMSHEVKLTCDMGQLVPFMCEETLPGDTFKVDSEMFLRMAPMLAPIMHRVNLKTYYFHVPLRLIWDDWKDWITGGEDGTFTSVKPKITLRQGDIPSSLYTNGSLADFLGFPTLARGAQMPRGVTRYIDALPFRAYQLIYNEYFRNQNLQDKVDFSKGSGYVTPSASIDLLTLRHKNWELDYFTSALPFAQRGQAMPIPMSGDISFKGVTEGSTVVRRAFSVPDYDTEGVSVNWNDLDARKGELVSSDSGNDLSIDNSSQLRLQSGEATINDLRTAYRVQRWLENNARAGSRYIEQILSHFGVKSSDARLQRPEFLGGGQSPVIVSQVLQNSQATQGNPLGNMAGHGISVGKTHKFKKFFEEHGFVIGILCVLPRTNYQNGLPRKYQRENRLDYYFPEFAGLGEQEILNSEVYTNWAEADGDAIDAEKERFGYQQRYSEYRYIPSTIHGDFKDSLSFWHLGRIFQSPQALNSDFVTANPDNRIFAVQNAGYPHLWIEFYNKVIAKRPMPKFAIPSL